MNTISYILGKFLMACRVGGLTVNTSKFTVRMFFSKEPIDIIHGSLCYTVLHDSDPNAFW